MKSAKPSVIPATWVDILQGRATRTGVIVPSVYPLFFRRYASSRRPRRAGKQDQLSCTRYVLMLDVQEPSVVFGLTVVRECLTLLVAASVAPSSALSLTSLWWPR